MKLILLVVMLSLSKAYALECEEYVPPEGVALSVEKDKDPSVGIVYIWAPLELEGAEVRSFIFSANKEIDGEFAELALPMNWKIKNNKAGSYFHSTPEWVNIEITVTYGDSDCGPELRASVRI
jgi:hypothetical protein